MLAAREFDAIGDAERSRQRLELRLEPALADYRHAAVRQGRARHRRDQVLESLAPHQPRDGQQAWPAAAARLFRRPERRRADRVRDVLDPEPRERLLRELLEA